jgi:hypothetical protein
MLAAPCATAVSDWRRCEDATILTDAETPAQGCKLNHERRLGARKVRISSFFRKRRFHSPPAWV